MPRAVSLLVALALCCAAPLAAQMRAAGAVARVPVQLVLSGEGGTGAMLELQPAGSGLPDRIVVGGAIDPRAFSHAVRALLAARRSLGPDNPHLMRYTVGSDVTRPALPWAPRVLRSLRQAPPRPVPGHGRVRTITIRI